MDSFVGNEALTDWPEEVGYWWFYGYRYGRQAGIHQASPELMLCQVVKIANGLMVIADGQSMYQSELEEPNFIPATLPQLPDLDTLKGE